MSSVNRKNFGDEAESKAVNFLEQNNYHILQTNYRCGHKEIDIICRKENLIVFVEVKASRSNDYGSPEEKVTPAKQKNIITAALDYIQKNKISGCDFRFDVITYRREKNEVRLNHLPAAFDATQNL